MVIWTEPPIKYRKLFLQNAARALRKSAADHDGEVRRRLEFWAATHEAALAELEQPPNISIRPELENQEMFRPCSSQENPKT
jgi:hypothetical protein